RGRGLADRPRPHALALTKPLATKWRRERQEAASPGRHHPGMVRAIVSEWSGEIISMPEASNRSRVTDVAPGPLRDLFEAGLNEAASCGPDLWALVLRGSRRSMFIARRVDGGSCLLPQGRSANEGIVDDEHELIEHGGRLLVFKGACRCA